MTLRRALESSKNQVTAHLLNAIASDPEESLSRVCGIALEAQLYKECAPYYPFVLGAQPLRLVDLAAFYAAIANEGARPAPYAIEAIDQGGRVVQQAPSLAWIGSGDRVAFYQLRTLLQGVLERGTGRSMRHLASYVAGKTGTSNNENDAWFVGFTNDVTVAVWVGYDNAHGQRRTLGKGQTGAKVALPIFEQIIRAVWQHHTTKTALGPPSSQVQRSVVALPIDLRTGDPVIGDGPAFTEQIRSIGGADPSTRSIASYRGRQLMQRGPSIRGWMETQFAARSVMGCSAGSSANSRAGGTPRTADQRVGSLRPVAAVVGV